MRKIKTIYLLIIITCLFIKINSKVIAITDPFIFNNNHFGIHIIDENDLELARDLVNSNGGQWGYVTIVIREDDRNYDKWQSTFDKMRERKLIPIIRLATRNENGIWIKPKEEDINSWVDFLDSLNWVVKNRYIVLFNEPNHANEWGGEVRPDEYAKILKLFHDQLKSRSNDFFILPAGLDASAPDSETSQSLYKFLLNLLDADKNVFKYLDGWTSHSYPNPDFKASPYELGKTSIVSYRDEKQFAVSQGLAENAPIFITETGWVHKTENNITNEYELQKIAQYYRQAFLEVWTDKDVIAITPFILRYLEPPFDKFSFFYPDGKTPYPHYYKIQGIKKIFGKPEQIEKVELDTSKIPHQLVIGSSYKISLTIENTGQSIWDESSASIKVISSSEKEPEVIEISEKLEPYKYKNVEISLSTPKGQNHMDIGITFELNGIVLSQKHLFFKLIEPPSLNIKAEDWIKVLSRASNYQLLIYDEGDLLKIFENLQIISGEGKVDEIYNIIPHKNYRFVLTRPNYLPRQKYEFMKAQETTVEFGRIIPIDFNGDGKFSDPDVVEVLKYPMKVFILLSPFSSQ